jgi:hypothetical protein
VRNGTPPGTGWVTAAPSALCDANDQTCRPALEDAMTRMRARRRTGTGVARLLVIAVVVWLIIGAIAAGQRHYFSGSSQTCAQASDIVVTVLAGPLNYVGVNPQLTCTLPQPST